MSIANFFRQFVRMVVLILHTRWSLIWVRAAMATHLIGIATDLLRSTPDLLIENALLRHQLVIPMAKSGGSGRCGPGHQAYVGRVPCFRTWHLGEPLTQAEEIDGDGREHGYQMDTG